MLRENSSKIKAVVMPQLAKLGVEDLRELDEYGVSYLSLLDILKGEIHPNGSQLPTLQKLIEVPDLVSKSRKAPTQGELLSDLMRRKGVSRNNIFKNTGVGGSSLNSYLDGSVEPQFRPFRKVYTYLSSLPDREGVKSEDQPQSKEEVEVEVSTRYQDSPIKVNGEFQKLTHREKIMSALRACKHTPETAKSVNSLYTKEYIEGEICNPDVPASKLQAFYHCFGLRSPRQVGEHEQLAHDRINRLMKMSQLELIEELLNKCK